MDIRAAIDLIETIVRTDGATAYHVTLARNLNRIKREGLVPRIGPRSKRLGEPVATIYVFPTLTEVEDAFDHWLADEFPEDARLALLKVILPEGSEVFSDAGYEMAVREPIPPENITVLSVDLGGEAGLSHLSEASDGLTSLPERSFKTLWHVGSLDPADKRDHSFEGAGLSVSVHPDAWRRIARGMVAGETWMLTKPGNRFIDAHKLDDKHHAMIEDWAVANGYAERAVTYRVTRFDDELDREVYMDFETREEAEDEAYDDDDQITEHPGQLVATDALRRLTRNPRARTQIEGLALTLYAEAHGYDGVWWNDLLDPVTYSAPRGVIVPSKVAEWTVERAR